MKRTLLPALLCLFTVSYSFAKEYKISSPDSKLNDIIKPVVANKRSEIRDNCNILTISFSSDFSLQFRAYDDGVAYRFETSLKEDITVKTEISEFSFPAGSQSWYPLETRFMSHNERTFIYSSLDTISNKHLASLPTLFQVNGVDVLITGALTNWSSREMDLDLSFLPEGKCSIEIFQDGANADRYAGDYKLLKTEVKSGDKMKIHLAPGGGWAARISPR